MSQADKVASDRELLQQAQSKGTLATLGAYLRLSGPGWLQSAITLGGGSLASSLYLGVLAGFTLMWLQPLAMILGIIMLSGIGYVTMSTGQRPLRAINEHVNPVLGWSWVMATLAANMVWCLPQYSLATGVLQQNLLPDLLGKNSQLGDFNGKLAIAIGILLITTLITWSYGSGSRGIKIYEILLKLLVGLIVICFVGVVIKVTADPSFSWKAVSEGFIPNWNQLFEPATSFQVPLSKVSEEYRGFWSRMIVAEQRDVMISAAATAVGINMTFLFPYSLLRKGWTREFRGLCVFDLFTGMLIPFVLATSCVIIASASQFHTQPVAGFVKEEGKETTVEPSKGMKTAFETMMKARLKQQLGETRFQELEKDKDKTKLAKEIEAIPDAEKRIAASLLKRDAGDLAQALAPLTGNTTANVVFGIGVLGMTLSTISLLMLISGFVACEIFNAPYSGWTFRLGTLIAATGALGPFVWKGAAFYLAVPTSVFGMALLPIAYLSFFLLINQKRLLKDDLPSGGKRLLTNVSMALAAGVALLASCWVIFNKAGYAGLVGVFALLFLAIAIPPRRKTEE